MAWGFICAEFGWTLWSSSTWMVAWQSFDPSSNLISKFVQDLSFCFIAERYFIVAAESVRSVQPTY